MRESPITQHDYQTMVDLLDTLLDEIGDQQTHPLMPLLNAVSLLIEDYETHNIQFPPPPTPLEVLRFFMNQHNLPETSLLNIFGSAANASEVLNGKRRINAYEAIALAARFHVSTAVFT